MTQTVHAWVVIDPLVRLHLVDSRHLDACVGPIQVPVKALVGIEPEVLPATSFLDDTILGLGGT